MAVHLVYCLAQMMAVHLVCCLAQMMTLHLVCSDDGCALGVLLGSDDDCALGVLLGSDDGCALGVLLGSDDGCALGVRLGPDDGFAIVGCLLAIVVTAICTCNCQLNWTNSMNLLNSVATAWCFWLLHLRSIEQTCQPASETCMGKTLTGPCLTTNNGQSYFIGSLPRGRW